MQKLKVFFNKQNLRRKLGLIASYTEILLAFIVIVGILLLCVRVITEFKILITDIALGGTFNFLFSIPIGGV